MIQSVDDLIKWHEGFTSVAKPDAKGKWAYGYGFDIPAPAEGASPPTITRAQADAMFPRYRQTAIDGVVKNFGYGLWNEIGNTARGAVLVDLTYELGADGVADFPEMIAAFKAGDFLLAAYEMLSGNNQPSKLFRQVPRRALENAMVLVTGEWPR